MRGRHILVTGGAGFIGSALVRHLIAQTSYAVTVLDKLTYAGNLASLADVAGSERYRFIQADICDSGAVASAIQTAAPDVIIHLAAESHVDRSVDGPAAFVRTNLLGTAALLEAATDYWRGLAGERRDAFRFHHVSTDEVFGTLPPDGHFTEQTAYDPRSPYSASKAGSDHLVRAWHHTYGLPAVLTNCSNNYGPFHYPDKLIPLMIIKCLRGEGLPVYGNGQQVRDWLHVDDHVQALKAVFERGRIGACYLIGGRSERTNLAVVHAICAELDRLRPRADGSSYRDLIRHVADRPGHDLRYAIDPSKLENELGWRARCSFESGLSRTVAWYRDNAAWWEPILAHGYAGQRLGLGQAARPGQGPGTERESGSETGPEPETGNERCGE